eukprot:6464622-Pyramimonas_sp.AAC.1
MHVCCDSFAELGSRVHGAMCNAPLRTVSNHIPLVGTRTLLRVMLQRCVRKCGFRRVIGVSPWKCKTTVGS